MENSDKYQSTSANVLNPKSMEKNVEKLRDIHIKVESIYEYLKNTRSSFIYKLIFFFLFSACAISFILHIFMFGLSFGVLFLVFLILFFFYYNYRVKLSLKKHIKTKSPEKIDPENPDFLRERIIYVSEGIKVTLERAGLLQIFYMVFFPLLIFILVDVIKGTFSAGSYVLILVLASLLGGAVWYIYYRADIEKISEDIEELEHLHNEISEYS